MAAPTTVTATAITAAKRERLCLPLPGSATAIAARCAATAITAAKRERLCLPLPGSATAIAARSAAATCSYCAKSNHFRDVLEEALHSGARLCRARVLQRRRT